MTLDQRLKAINRKYNRLIFTFVSGLGIGLIVGYCVCSLGDMDKIRELEKEVERLTPYEDMYKIMADSIGNIHAPCFIIGKH